MALTNSERQRKFREKKKEVERSAPDEASLAQEIAPMSFSAFLKGYEDWESGKHNELMFIGETLDSIGQAFPDLEVDKDPEWRPEWSVENKGSLGRAERMVDGWIDCAKTLSELINQFKVERVNRALEILSASDMSDPERRKQVLAKIVKLEKVKERLQKEVRHSFRVTSVKGE